MRYRITSTIHFLLFFFFSIIFLNFSLPAELIVLICLLNDAATLVIAVGILSFSSFFPCPFSFSMFLFDLSYITLKYPHDLTSGASDNSSYSPSSSPSSSQAPPSLISSSAVTSSILPPRNSTPSFTYRYVPLPPISSDPIVCSPCHSILLLLRLLPSPLLLSPFPSLLLPLTLPRSPHAHTFSFLAHASNARFGQIAHLLPFLALSLALRFWRCSLPFMVCLFLPSSSYVGTKDREEESRGERKRLLILCCRTFFGTSRMGVRPWRYGHLCSCLLHHGYSKSQYPLIYFFTFYISSPSFVLLTLLSPSPFLCIF